MAVIYKLRIFRLLMHEGRFNLIYYFFCFSFYFYYNDDHEGGKRRKGESQELTFFLLVYSYVSRFQPKPTKEGKKRVSFFLSPLYFFAWPRSDQQFTTNLNWRKTGDGEFQGWKNCDLKSKDFSIISCSSFIGVQDWFKEIKYKAVYYNVLFAQTNHEEEWGGSQLNKNWKKNISYLLKRLSTTFFSFGRCFPSSSSTYITCSIYLLSVHSHYTL